MRFFRLNVTHVRGASDAGDASDAVQRQSSPPSEFSKLKEINISAQPEVAQNRNLSYKTSFNLIYIFE